jgi:diaminopimelate decarboxylase
MLHVKNKSWYAESVPFEQLAETYGTPLYVYSAGQITANYQAYDAALRQTGLRTHIHFAVKTNYNLAVLRHLKNLGAGADLVSGGEMKRALAAGISANNIIFSGVAKTDDELRMSLAEGICQINLESAEELERLIAIARGMNKKIDCAVRINPDVDAKTHAKVSTGKSDNKFGVDLNTAAQMFERAATAPEINLRCIASHIGSQLLDIAPYDDAFMVMAEFARELQAKGHAIDRMDIGGGVGVPYAPGDVATDLNMYAGFIKKYFGGFQGEIYTEPGRYLVANAGALLTRVIFIKRTAHKIFVVVDAAMNDLMRPALYDSYHPIFPAHENVGETMICDIVGGICETTDIFASNRTLPASLKAGDLMVIGVAGAYGATMAGTFNARDQIAEVFVSGNQHQLVRDRWTIEQQMALEHIPDFLQKA